MAVGVTFGEQCSEVIGDHIGDVDIEQSGVPEVVKDGVDQGQVQSDLDATSVVEGKSGVRGGMHGDTGIVGKLRGAVDGEVGLDKPFQARHINGGELSDLAGK